MHFGMFNRNGLGIDDPQAVDNGGGGIVGGGDNGDLHYRDLIFRSFTFTAGLKNRVWEGFIEELIGRKEFPEQCRFHPATLLFHHQ